MISLEKRKEYFSSNGKEKVRIVIKWVGATSEKMGSNILLLTICFEMDECLLVASFLNSGNTSLLPSMISETYSTAELRSLKLPMLLFSKG